MSESVRLKLPYLEAAQAQKHVTVNEGLAVLDALVSATALDKDLTAPPGGESDGDAYIVAAGSSGAWAGWDDSLAAVIDGSYVRHLPFEGMMVWVADEASFYVYASGAWTAYGGGALSDLSDVTITAIAAGELLVWDGADWINRTLAEAGIAAASHSHSAADIASGTLAHERGGLEADVSAYAGLVKISGGATSAVAAPSGAVVGTTDTQTLTGKTIDGGNNTLQNIPGSALATRIAFSVTRGGSNQSIASATLTKVQFTTEDFDIGGYFDAATNYRFQPPAGYYRLSFTVSLDATNGVADEYVITHIYKNGSSFRRTIAHRPNATLYISSVTTCTVYANGSDHFEFYAYKGGAGAGNIYGDAGHTYVSGEVV